jgi:quercetin dioxygenase-like cupin family protein
MDPIVKALVPGDKSWTFLDGSGRSAVNLRSASIGLGCYRPGWKWSEHTGRQTGKTSEAHIGYIISGRMCVQASDGAKADIGPGEAFEVLPGHDAWVIGDDPCIALDFGT